MDNLFNFVKSKYNQFAPIAKSAISTADRTLANFLRPMLGVESAQAQPKAQPKPSSLTAPKPSRPQATKAPVAQAAPSRQVQGSQALPPIHPNLSVFASKVATPEAQMIARDILTRYKPSGVAPDYQSPLLPVADLIGSESAAYGIDPRLLPLLAFAESGGLRAGVSSVKKNNPWNVMRPGTQDLHQYPDLEEATRQYASGIGGPLSDPSGKGLERYSNFQKMGNKSTLKDFIHTQNPTDNPERELDVILQLAKQLGV